MHCMERSDLSDIIKKAGCWHRYLDNKLNLIREEKELLPDGSGFSFTETYFIIALNKMIKKYGTEVVDYYANRYDEIQRRRY